MYKTYVESKEARQALEDIDGSSTFSSLSFITTLKKLCNHPALVVDKVWSSATNAAAAEIHCRHLLILPAQNV